MSLIFIEGWDCYGTNADLIIGKWTSGGVDFNRGLLTTGRFGPGTGKAWNSYYAAVNRTFESAETIIIGCAVNLVEFGHDIFTFFDVDGNLQIKLSTDVFGRLKVHRGDSDNLIVIGNSNHFVTLNAWNYIEFKVTIAAIGGYYEVRVNDQTVLSATTNTQNTISTSAEVSALTLSGFITYQMFDDLYMCDSLGTINNDFLGDTRVETLYPAGDILSGLSSVNVIGNSSVSASDVQNVTTIDADQMLVEQFISMTNGTITTGQILFQSTSLTAKTTMVVYSDDSGVPGTLLGVSDEVLGSTLGDLNSYTFSAISVVLGTNYWIGLMSSEDMAVSYMTGVGGIDYTGGHVCEIANTYTDGAPTSPTGMTASTTNYCISCGITGGSNYSAISERSEDGDFSYVTSNTSSFDSYTFDALTSDTQNVYGLQLSPLCRKTATAPRTVETVVQTPSMTGLVSPMIYPGTDYVYYPQVYNTQSDGTTPWTVAAVNGMTAGIQVD